jgi:hypothetical protein
LINRIYEKQRGTLPTFCLSFTAKGLAFVEPSLPTVIPSKDAPADRPEVEGRLYLVNVGDLMRMKVRFPGYDLVPVLALNEKEESVRAVTLKAEEGNKHETDFPPAPMFVNIDFSFLIFNFSNFSNRFS